MDVMEYILAKFRDPLSGLTHCIGALLAVTGLVLLVCKAASPAKPWHIVSFSIFGSGMVLLYTASTLYHWLPLTDRGIACFRKIDHMMIFVLIAATYTPVCLVPLRGGWGWSIFGSVWGLAVTGMFLKLFWIGAPRWLSTSIYLAMGWMAVVGVWPLIQKLQAGALLWLLVGGVFYTVGAVIYGVKKPNPWPPHIGFHEIFHVFVVLGTLSHFWVMYRYIIAFA